MREIVRALAASLMLAVSPLTRSAGPTADPTADMGFLLGFRPPAVAQQRELEKQFDGLLEREHLRDWMKRMSARPHHVGSAFGKENAQFIASQFESWGYETKIEQFGVLFPTPRSRSLELIAPVAFVASLSEPVLPQDSTSGVAGEGLPSYNAYSCDGDVTGQLVYVNYGVPKDYETLAERGIDVQGRIVIARYGGAWRGIKPKVAAEHGAIGCLIYSDPHEDGFFQGDVYPQGAWRSEAGVQRGSVADMPLYPGDPLTPGIGAVPGAVRLRRQEAATITKVPVLPISYADALPLLRALTNGPVAPAEWRGSLPLTYHLGPGPATVRLRLAFNWDTVPAFDVVATLPGSERPDEWIIRGNHHDAWVFGADDPLSGTVAVMEEARAMSVLRARGWQPKRTIVFALWDGEEPGLLGSTEWVEAHALSLAVKAAVYVNGDNNGRGFLQVGGSHSLEKFANEIARDVIDPEKRISAGERLRAYRRVRGSDEDRKEAHERGDLRINALGSGSDYTPFLQHAGVASLDIRFGGENLGGEYHSIYDSFDHYRRFGDPQFDYGIALAQTAGRAVLRFANAEVLPFEFTNLAETLSRYVAELVKLADSMRQETREHNGWLEQHILAAVLDPTEVHVLPAPKLPVPFLNFAPLENARARLQTSARTHQMALAKWRSAPGALGGEAQTQLDATLIATERAMLIEAGLPQRPWYKHAVYAPGFYTGYGVKTLPGVREAIEGRQWNQATEQIRVAAERLERVSDAIDRAAELLAGGREMKGAR